jgi:hypothetical protein
MPDLSLQELDAQFSELLPEREALAALGGQFNLHHFHHHHHHHHVPKPCPPKHHPYPPVKPPCPPVKLPCPPVHHYPPPPPPCHDKPVLPHQPGKPCH